MSTQQTESPVVLCFGDSNTHGRKPMRRRADAARYGAGERWPGYLKAALPHITVIEEGHPGRTTVHDDPIEGPHKNGLAVLPALLETHRPIDLVVMMLGTNDFKTRFSVTASDVARSLEKLAGIILASQTGPGEAPPGLVIVSPPPIRETGLLASMFEGGEARSRDLAPRVEAIARSCGAAFIDGGDYAAVSDLDGVHLDAESHAALGSAVARVVAEQLDR